MLVRDKNAIPPVVRADGVAMTDLLGGEIPAGAGVTMGYAVFPPGTRCPPPPHGRRILLHPLGDGQVRAGGRGAHRVGGHGDLHPRPGRRTASFNDGAAEAALVWMLVEK